MNLDKISMMAHLFSKEAKITDSIYNYPPEWWNRLASGVEAAVEKALKSEFGYNYNGGTVNAEAYGDKETTPGIIVVIPRLDNPNNVLGDEGTRKIGMEATLYYLAQHFEQGQGHVYYSVIFPGEEVEWNAV